MFEILLGIGLFLSAAGTATTVHNQQKSADAQQDAIEAQRRTAELDRIRRVRELVRQQNLARSMALTTTTAQGASLGSGLEGAYGQISGRMGVNELGINQNYLLGQNIFSARAAQSSAEYGAALGQGLTTLGGAVLRNVDTLNRFGTYMSSPSQPLASSVFSGRGSELY